MNATSFESEHSEEMHEIKWRLLNYVKKLQAAATGQPDGTDMVNAGKGTLTIQCNAAGFPSLVGYRKDVKLSKPQLERLLLDYLGQNYCVLVHSSPDH